MGFDSQEGDTKGMPDYLAHGVLCVGFSLFIFNLHCLIWFLFL